MASESSELTFVRCPSCRSLVPASASRCRICNNPLEASGGAAGDDAAKSASRVRQRTMSANAEQLLGEAEAASSPPPPAVPEPVLDGAPPPQGSGEELDPLGAFLEEFEEPVPAQPAPAAVLATPSEAAGAPNGGLDPLDGLNDFDIDPEPIAAEPSAPVSHDEHANHDQLDPLSALMDEELIPEPAPPAQPEQRVEVAPAPAPAAIERIEEPAPPPKKEVPPPPPPRQSPPPQQKGQQNNQRHAQPNQEHRAQRDSKPPQGGGHERREVHRHEKRGEEGKKGSHQQHHQHGGKQHERHGDRNAERPPAHAQGGPKMGKVRPGRLFGWLVSFESPDGRAIELREGKFFVTGTSIRGTDLVVEDPSISTPHALMSVNGESGLMIQDLMSDRGVFRRSGDRGQYVREDGVFTLEHGDWVRFGDVEFLVTIVPSQK
jgi:hypothetical protein